MRLLAVKLDHIGDFALALPALRQARAVGAEIDIVVSPWNLGWREIVPWINRWWVCRFRAYRRSDKSLADWSLCARDLMELGWELPNHHYDAAVDLRTADGDWRGSLVTWLSQAPRCVGGLGCGGFFESEAYATTAIHQEDCVRERLAYVLPLPNQDFHDYVSISRVSVDRRIPCVALHPGSNGPARRWIDRYWMELLGLLREVLAPSTQIVLLGGNAEKALIDAMAEAHPEKRVQTCFPRSLQQFMEFIAAADLVVGVNSMPQHAARLLGTPCVTIFSGEEDPLRWAARGDNTVLYSHVECAPCRAATCRQASYWCMERITPEQVLRTIMDRLRVIRPEALRY